MLPQTITPSFEVLQKCIGFTNIRKVIRHLDEVALPTVKIPNIGQPLSKHKGEVATLPKRPALKPSPKLPPLREDTIHYDIAHGTGTAIGGVKYVLLFITKEKKHLYEYPLRTLKEQSIRQALQLFINDLGYKPKVMLADRDFKLIGGGS